HHTCNNERGKSVGIPALLGSSLEASSASRYGQLIRYLWRTGTKFDNGGSFIEGSDCPPPSPPVTHPPSGPQSLRSVRTHSVASEASFDGTRPVTVCIDRNVFKSWFDTDAIRYEKLERVCGQSNAPPSARLNLLNVPEFQQLRVKRYRTIDSFVHWMMKYCKR
ncbi:hypothetical protein FOZ63_012344, partial [Perkinsus olseni]